MILIKHLESSFLNVTACYECIDDFQCPQDAFIIDEASGKVFIDQNRCISCYDCLNDFECQYDAITRLPISLLPQLHKISLSSLIVLA